MPIVGKENRKEANAVAQRERLAYGGKPACLEKGEGSQEQNDYKTREEHSDVLI